jgi:hypothetical protein
MRSAVAYNLYVTTPTLAKCTDESCYGDPEEFLKGLTGSRLAELLEQYTRGGANAYKYGASVNIQDPTMRDNVFYDNDVYDVLATAYHKFKASGYTTIYHIFLPPGADNCFTFETVCYSPNYPPANLFCAYHDDVTLDRKVHLIYSVEPYQNYSLKYRGQTSYPCGTPHAGGTNPLDNATNDSLEHESFEAFTDPDPPTGWVDLHSYDISEVADECEDFYAVQHYHKVTLNLQLIYSNKIHACTDNAR